MWGRGVLTLLPCRTAFGSARKTPRLLEQLGALRDASSERAACREDVALAVGQNAEEAVESAN